MANNCTRDTLKSFFQTGDVPTQGNFEDFIESVPNLNDNNTLSGYNHFETGIHIGNLSGGSGVVQASSATTGLMLAGSEGAQTESGDQLFGANIELNSYNHPTLSSIAFYDAASHNFRDQTGSNNTTLFVNGSACISSGLSSDGNTFTVEPLNNRVGIGTNVPDTTLDVDGHSQVHVSPENKIDNSFVFSVKADNKTGASTELVGPTKIVHDFFKHSGETCGFADKSNHFHDIVRINKITQDGTGDNLNLERTQQQYYAVTSNVLRNENAAFLNHSRVTRSINNIDVAMTNLTGWDVSDIEDSSNRSATSQVPFTQSESTFMTFNSGSNPFVLNDLLQITIDTEFPGAIVAATLFAKVVSVSNTSSGDRAEIKLYSGNYKTINEVPKQKTQTSLSAEFSVQKIDSSHYMALATGTGATVTTDNTRLYANDSFTLEFNSSQDLKLNDVITLLTDGTNGFQSAEVATVSEIVTPGTKFKFVYGPLRFNKDNLELTTLPNSSIVGVLKGSLDGLHRMTIGDSFYNFFSDNSGRYDTFTIGPGTQADNLTGGNIAIGKNIYNSKAGTMLLGYENNTMTLSSDGSVGIGTNTPNKTLTVVGDISATGTLTVPNLETNVEVSDFTVNGGFSADGNTFTVEDTNNRVGIGTNIPNKTLTVIGEVSATGNTYVNGLTASNKAEFKGDLTVSGGFSADDVLFVDKTTNRIGINNSNTGGAGPALNINGDLSGNGGICLPSKHSKMLLGTNNMGNPGLEVRGDGSNCSGFVGIGKSNPTIPLHIVHPNSNTASGPIGEALRVVGSTLLTTKGDTVLTIQAESDNAGDDDEPLLKLRKGLTNAGEACLAIHGAGNEYSGKITDAVYLKASKDGISCSHCENIQFVVNEVAGITLAGSGSKIPNVTIGDCGLDTHNNDNTLTLSKATTAANFLKLRTYTPGNRQGICFEKDAFTASQKNLGEIRWNNISNGSCQYTAGITVSASYETGTTNSTRRSGGVTVFHNKADGQNLQPIETMRIFARPNTTCQPGVVIAQGLSANNTLFVKADSNAVSVAGSLSGATLSAGNGFSGTGAYTTFTIQNGIITAAS